MNNQLPALGEPLPASKHAVSVSLPKWADVVGYEEADPRVIDAMKTGYPRFVYNPITKKLFAEAEKKFAKGNEFCLVFPSERVAKLCVSFSLRQWNEQNSTIINYQPLGINQFSEKLWAVTFPKEFQKIAKSFWQHPGFIISSRQAEAVLAGQKSDESGDETKRKIRQHLSKLTNEKIENIYLFPSGMAAIFSAFEITSSGPTIQLGFPYVDTLKIQEKFGNQTIFLSDVRDLAALEKNIKEKNATAVFIEFPTNPLLDCVDLERLSNICRANKCVLVIDDTLSSWANVDLSKYADITVSSLTKFFSGIGDVLAGSLILNSQSPLYPHLKLELEKIYEDLLYPDDAVVLEKNSHDFETRIAKVNSNAEQLADWLNSKIADPEFISGSIRRDPETSSGSAARVFYTKGNPLFEKYKTGGYGGIISIVLPTEDQAIKFFDALEVNKGPSLGTNYTLACPYTLLAHYHEREFAESAGVPFHLIRVSVGLENFDELKVKFEKALSASKVL